jgi:hypothetical protein
MPDALDACSVYLAALHNQRSAMQWSVGMLLIMLPIPGSHRFPA